MKNLLKTLITRAIVTGLLTGMSFANTNFEIRTQSLNGDYIGQGESWNFSSNNGSFLTVKKATSQEVSFDAESFDISRMNFDFSAGDGQTLQNNTLYYPAKRNPFRGSYNGIDISGDGRGCNKILGGFYVHEYDLTNGTLNKAAIDFVQYCEENQNKPLYGSLRYNSNIANTCNGNDCSGVQKYLKLDTPVTTTNLDTPNTQTPTESYITNNELSDDEQLQIEITEITFDIFESMEKNYPFFYQECVAVQDQAALLMDPEYKNYLNPSGCHKKHIGSLTIANKLLTKIFGPWSDEQNEDVTIEELNEAVEFLDFLSERILLVKNKIQNQGNLTESLKIVLGGVAYVTEFSSKLIQLQIKYES